MSVFNIARKIGLAAMALTLAVPLFVAVQWIEGKRSAGDVRPSFVGADASGVVRSIFSQGYPNNSKFQEELTLLRSTKRLDTNNEELINRLVRTSSQELTMPPGILWCLLFQESRFDHLTGLGEDRMAKGLGQFAYFSFHEINHHLDRFTQDNLKMFISVLGWDMRPIAPLQDQVSAPASYYYIPTAVTTSAAFLNNRYHQLRRVLDRKNIPYSNDILWLYSAMAYNKGTRSVLSYWNKSLAKAGRREVERLLLDPGELFRSLEQKDRFVQSLSHIWPKAIAERYAEEVTRHLKQIKECSVDPELAKQLEAASRRKGRGTL